MQHVISTKQFLDSHVLLELFTLAKEMEDNDKHGIIVPSLKGKILASLFYEPSTRTRFSFEAAMHKLGGSVIATESAIHFSSVTKGEVLEDTIRIIGGYADVIILRHTDKGAAQVAAENSQVPIINAGDGAGEHPTQALLDLYTIFKEKGGQSASFNGLHIGLIGDLLYGRTIHSLLYLLTLYPHVRISLISPPQLALPAEYKAILHKHNIEFSESPSLEEKAPDLDVLYMTRVQKERFPSIEAYLAVKDSCKIDASMLPKLKDSAMILHPLPRVSEISHDVDKDPRAAYFRQARNGLYIRMAILHQILTNKR